MVADPEELKSIRDEIDETVRAGASPTIGQLRREYTALANRNKTLVVKFSRRVFRLLIALTVGLLILGVASLKLTSDIQNSRLDQCEMSNERHVNTKIELERTIKELPPDRRAELRAQQKGTERLLNALAPLKDCSKL